MAEVTASLPDDLLAEVEDRAAVMRLLLGDASLMAGRMKAIGQVRDAATPRRERLPCP